MALSQCGLAAVLRDRGPDTVPDRTNPSLFLPEERRRPMSAADAADRVDHPQPAPEPGGAAVFHIGTRTHRMPSGGRYRVPNQPQDGYDGHDSPDEAGTPQDLAEHLETTFNQNGLTLTDDSVAGAFTVTLGIVRGMLQGAAVQGVIDEDQRAELDALFQGMTGAPHLL